MANARGDRTQILMRRQANFKTGEDPVDGNFVAVPAYGWNVSPSEEASADTAFQQDANPMEIVAGLRGLAGEIEVPLGMASIGWHLFGMFGAPSTTEGTGEDAGVFTHIFETGEQTFQHLTAGITHAQISKHFRQIGLNYNEMNLTGRKGSERARARFGMIGHSEEVAASALDSTPVSFSPDPVPVSFVGETYVDDVKDALITNIDLRVSANKSVDQEQMNGSNTPEEVYDGRWGISGSLTRRFRNTALYEQARAGDLSDIELRWVISANEQLRILARNCRFELFGQPVQSGEIITSQANFTANPPNQGDESLTITLVNGVANYANPS